MLKLIYISLLVLISSVNCDDFKKEGEVVKDKSDPSRVGFLLGINDCFGLYFGKSIGTIVYDGKSILLKDVKITEGNCLTDIKEKADGKEVINKKEAKVIMEFNIEEGIENLSKVKVELRTVLDLRYDQWTLNEAFVYGTSKDNKKAIVKLAADYFEAPVDYSFSCGSLELLKKIDIDNKPDQTDSFEYKFNKIIFKDFQIQPFKGDEVFNASYDCATWFTIGTITGLIVLILFTSILAFGILYIMDIKTNDRFEDPKGKPLSLGQIDG